MREFIYFSRHARTSGNFRADELMKAGRMDIAIHVIIAAFFLSHRIREDVKLHLIFYGPPDPPKHIEIQADSKMSISKKDIAGLLKRILYKYKKGKRTSAFPGCFIEKKSLNQLVEELADKGREIYVLDRRGEDIRNLNLRCDSSPVFVLGDQDGFPSKELRRLKKIAIPVSIGPQVYFASHTLAVVQNELDRRCL